eukprot:5201359-Pleurochrysis_carterae.AAC.2
MRVTAKCPARNPALACLSVDSSPLVVCVDEHAIDGKQRAHGGSEAARSTLRGRKVRTDQQAKPTPTRQHILTLAAADTTPTATAAAVTATATVNARTPVFFVLERERAHRLFKRVSAVFPPRRLSPINPRRDARTVDKPVRFDGCLHPSEHARVVIGGDDGVCAEPRREERGRADAAAELEHAAATAHARHVRRQPLAQRRRRSLPHLRKRSGADARGVHARTPNERGCRATFTARATSPHPLFLHAATSELYKKPNRRPRVPNTSSLGSTASA